MSKGVNIEEVIKKVTKEAIKEFDKEQKEGKRKKVFHNTRLLLSHYNDLRAHVDNAIDDVRQLEEDLTELGDIERDELYILSIKRSKSKTLIMIAHIDMAMELLRQKQVKADTEYKYEALKMVFFDKLTYEDVQERFECSKNTPGRWINQMINELSILLFGIDGLKLDMVQ